MFKEIIIGWLTFVFALAFAIGVIFVVGAFVIWLSNVIENIVYKLRMRKYRKSTL